MVDRSAFLTSRRGSDPLVRTLSQSISATLSKPMEWIDAFASDSIVRGRYMQNISRGLSEDAAIADADAYAASVIGDRSRGAMPTLFYSKNPFIKMFTQFQLEVNNTFSYIFKDIPRDQRERGNKAIAAAMFKFALGSWAFNELYELITGRRCMFDPIEMLNNTFEDGLGVTPVPNPIGWGIDGFMNGLDWDIPFIRERGGISGRSSVGDTIVGLLKRIGEETPFASGIIAAQIGDSSNRYVPAASGLPDLPKLFSIRPGKSWKKNIENLYGGLKGPFSYVLPPFGGGQVRKVIEGIEGIIRGGKYTYDNDGNKKLKYPVYNDSVVDKVKNWLLSPLFGSSATGGARDWVRSDFDTFSVPETAAFIAACETGLWDRKAYSAIYGMTLLEPEKGKKSVSAYQKNEYLMEENIPDRAKFAIYCELIAGDAERDVMLALTDMDEDAGEVYNVLSRLRTVKGDGKASQKADIVRESRLSTEGCAYLWGRYVSKSYADKLADAGLDDADALGLAWEFAMLEPDEGKKNVSSAQRERAVAEYELSSDDRLAALEAISSESRYEKIYAASEYDIDPAVFVHLSDFTAEYTEDESGVTQEEAQKAINDLSRLFVPADGTTKGYAAANLTRKQKAVLWQLMSKSWKAESNPYSVTVGKKVRRDMGWDDK